MIACNLPSLSFRVANSLPRRIQQGFDLSLFGLRHAAAKLSLRSSSGPGSGSASRDEKKTGNTTSNAGTALQVENGRRSGQSGSIGSATVVETTLPYESKEKGEPEEEEDSYLKEGEGKKRNRGIAGSQALSDAPFVPPPLELAGEGRFIDESELVPRVEYFLDGHTDGRGQSAM